MGATVDSDPDPDEFVVAGPDSDELHALATTAVTRSTGATRTWAAATLTRDHRHEHPSVCLRERTNTDVMATYS